MRVVAVACLVLVCASAADARNHLSGKPEEEAGPVMEVRPSGLVPVFPRDAACPEIASPFGSLTRYDGSRRVMDRFGGVHGGIDISLAEGTPLLAIAAGKVVMTGTGGIFTGHYLWLQHSPDDTGLPFWVYSKYQHFRDAPDLPVGTVVKVGQPVGKSGKTGTTGRHYGMNGYPHLHLTTFAGGGEKYETRDSTVSVAGSKIVDPVSIYATGGDKRVTIPYATDDGAIVPPGSRIVWPVACKRR